MSRTGSAKTATVHWRSALTVVPVVLALLEVALLLGYAHGPWRAMVGLPVVAIATVILGRKYQSLMALAFACLTIGGIGIFCCAPLNAALTFAYPAFFACVIALAQSGRLLPALIASVAICASGTFLLDVFQTHIEYPDKKVIVLASMWARGEAKVPILEKAIAGFEKENPQYKVVVHWDGRWVLSKNRPRLLTGQDVPDIIEGAKSELRILVAEDYALPMDDYLDKPSWVTGKPWRDDFLPTILGLCRYNFDPSQSPRMPALEGKTCLIPGIDYYFFYFYNKAIARKLGVERMPQTWDEFCALCQKAKDAGIEPITMDAAYLPMFSDTALQAFIPPDELRKTILGLPGFKPFTHPMYLRIFQMEQKIDDHYLMNGWQASAFPAAQQAFATGKGLFNLNGSWLPGELREVASKDKSVFDLGAMNMPRFADDPPGTMVVSASGWMVLKGGHEHEGAVKLLQYFSDHLGKDLVEKGGNPVAFSRAPLPAELSDVADAIAHTTRAVDNPIQAFAPNWLQYVFRQLHADFCRAKPGDADYMTADEFLRKLEARTSEYRAKGGEAQWQ